MEVMIPGYLEYHRAVLPSDKHREILAFLAALHTVATAGAIVAGTPALVDRPPITVRGTSYRQRRSVGFFGPDGVAGYRYSGQMAPRQDLPPVLVELLGFVNTLLGTRLNAILLNHYEDGNQCIGAHRDASWGLVPGQPIVALSFGATRIFRIRELAGKKIVLNLPLEDNSLVVMRRQRHHTHEIPPEKKVAGERWSITLRAHAPT